MMKRLFLLLLVVCCVPKVHSTPNIPQLYQTLDSLIAFSDEIMTAKERHIESLGNGLQGIHLSSSQRYEFNMRLYDEYVAFRFDSAYYYIRKNISLAEQEGVPQEQYAASLIRLSHILSVSGLFNKAERILTTIHPERLSDTDLVDYYNQRVEINLYRSEMAQYSPFFSEYIDSAQYYRQKVMQVAPKESFAYITNYAGYICETGDVDGAIRMFERYLPTFQSGDRRYSIVASTLAFFYMRKGDQQMQERYLLLSAISDVKGAILENISFRELSLFLLDRGELEKAYIYLSRASGDAKAYGSGLRSLQVARLAPVITNAYDLARNQTQRRTNILLLAVSVSALLLLALMLFTLSLLRKRRIASRKISLMNEELSHHNEEIQTLNGQMKEDNLIKEEYIGRFLQLCSDLVHRGEERNKLLNRLARDRKLEDLYAELKNYTTINEGVRLFHQNFDTAFLNIYPNFIDEVNKLMMEENRFEKPDDAKKLSTELRILALIRLGITDNQRIADILRSSITTIYTYRSKMKARAVSKDTFEDDICKIGTY